MRGYKAFNKDLICRGFQYEIGETYEMDGEIEICERGFHFCKDLANCYKFYLETEDTRICEVEALGEIKTNDNIKYCTNKIKILSEVENPREQSNTDTSSSGYCNDGAYNCGNWNYGRYNTGDRNIGTRNSGDFNVGHWNSGHCNTGDHNVGYGNRGNHNTGDYNTGDCNTGYCNSGYKNCGRLNEGNFNTGSCNSGFWNTGDWNSGNYHTGIFNCDTKPKIKIFDKESDWTMMDWLNSKAYHLMCRCPLYHYAYYDTVQGKLIIQKATRRDRQLWWDGLHEDEKNIIKELPNFDVDKFYLCTGIRVTENNTED